MKTRVKRLLSVVLVMAMLSSLLTFPAAAYTVADGSWGYGENSQSWELDSDGTLTFSGTGEMEDFFDYDPEFRPDSWLDYSWQIERVIIEDGITSIGARLFKDCSSIVDVSIPNGVTRIGGEAFSYCSSLPEIVIPEGVISIGDEAFSYCSSLETATIPEGVTNIGSSAFKNCSSLKEITIPVGVTSIKSGTFRNCSSLEEITIPARVVSIGIDAFSNCSELTTVHFGGTESEWNAISISSGNDALTSDSVSIIFQGEDPVVNDTLTFTDGANTYDHETLKADTYSLSAPGDGYYFAGWFAGLSADGERIVLENDRYVLSSVDTEDLTSFTASELRPKYEDAPEEGAYNALWIHENDLNPTVMVLEVYPDSIVYRKASCTDSDKQIITTNDVLRSAWSHVNGGGNGRVKLVKDMTVDDFAYKGSVDSSYFGCGLWLDLNGRTITDTFEPGVSSWYSGGSVVFLRENNSAVDSSHGQGKLVLDTSVNDGYTSRKALDLSGVSQHTVKWVRDVDLDVNCPNAYPHALLLGGTTLELMDNVNITQNCQEGNTFYAIYSSDAESRQAHVETVSNCTVTTNGSIWRQDFPGAYVHNIENCTFVSTATTGSGFEVAGEMTFGAGNIITTDAPVLFARADRAAGSLAFTADGTYSAKESGQAFDGEVLFVQTPVAGAVPHNDNGTLEFVAGFTLTYMSHDGNETLWKDSYAAGETPVDSRSLTYPVDHVSSYTFDGWGTGVGAGVIDVTALSADTTLYAQRSETVLETLVIRTLEGAAPESFALWEDAIDIGYAYWGKNVTLQLQKDATVGSGLRGGYHKATYDLNGHTLNYVGTDVFYKDTYSSYSSFLTVTSTAAQKGVLHIENNTGLYLMVANSNKDNPLTINNVRVEAPDLVSEGAGTSAYGAPNGLISFYTSGTSANSIKDVYVTDSELSAPQAPVIDYYTGSTSPGTQINSTLVHSSLEGGTYAVNIHGISSANLVLTLTADRNCTFKNAEGTDPIKVEAGNLKLTTAYPEGCALEPIGEGWYGFAAQLQSIVITLDPNGGTLPAGVEPTISVTFGENYPDLTGKDPEPASGFVFDHWEDEDGSVYDTSKPVPDHDTVVTAKYRVGDLVAPPAVTDITSTSSSSIITLFWPGYEAPNDFSHFNVLRLENGEYVPALTGIRTLGANITGLTPGTAYFFLVEAVDRYGNTSVSEPVSAATAEDSAAPRITAITPDPAGYNGTIPLQFRVSDDHDVVSLTVQYSFDGVDWTDIATLTDEAVSGSALFSFSLDTTAYPEGLLYVRGVAWDACGKQSDTSANAPFNQYMIDRTPPAAPAGLTASVVSGYVRLSWANSTDEGQNKYSLYRSDTSDGAYAAIGSDLYQLAFNDARVTAGQTYYYKLRCSDPAGNLSAFSEAVSVAVPERTDETAPIIVSVYPGAANACVLAPDTAISAKVYDDMKVAALYARYSADSGAWTQWQAISVDAVESVVTLPFTGASIGCDTLSIELYCEDTVGRVSETVSLSYTVDNAAPQTPVLTPEAAPMRIELSWTSGAESDLAGFYIYRRAEDENDFTRLTSCSAARTSYTDRAVSTGTAYSYYVSAVDERGNVSDSAATALIAPIDLDDEAPVLHIEAETVGAAGSEMRFSALRSTDNIGIESYSWDFGDGSEPVFLPDAAHVYEGAGTYTVTATATDAADNSSSFSFEVTVREAAQVAYLDVTVKDENGTPLRDAGVYILGSEQPFVSYTDASGVAHLAAPGGSYRIGVYKEGYLPADREVELVDLATTAITISVVEQELVSGEFQVERMTLEEIIAAGIDVEDPANQHIFNVVIQITYADKPVTTNAILNGLGDMLSPPSPIHVVDGGGNARELDFTFVDVGDDLTFGGPGVEEPKVVAALDIPVQVSWLKEMFDVHLHIFNNADPQFALDHCHATLDVPDGMTLMDPNNDKPAHRYMGTIYGGYSSSVDWYLRGDTAGSYPLSADFSATLRDFNVPISAEFTSSPVTVYGEKALKLIADVDLTSSFGAVYLDLSLMNVCDVDVYMPSMTIFDDVVFNYDYIEPENEEDEEEIIVSGHPSHPIEILGTKFRFASGQKIDIENDVTFESLAPGEAIIKRLVIYDVSDVDLMYLYNAVVLQAEDSGFVVEINDVSADRFNTYNAKAKADHILSDGVMFEYYYALDNANSNYYYMLQAVADDEDFWTDVTQEIYEWSKAIIKFDTHAASGSLDKEITRQFLAELLADEGFRQAVDMSVESKALSTTSKILSDLALFVPTDPEGDTADTTAVEEFNDILSNESTLRALAGELKEGSGKSFTNRLLTLAATTGSAHVVNRVQNWLTEQYTPLGRFEGTALFTEAAGEAINHVNDVISEVDYYIEGWNTSVDALQKLMQIDAAHEQALILTEMLLKYHVGDQDLAYIEEVQRVHNEIKEGYKSQLQAFADEMIDLVADQVVDYALNDLIIGSIDNIFFIYNPSAVFGVGLTIKTISMLFDAADYLFGWEDTSEVFHTLRVSALLSYSLKEATEDLASTRNTVENGNLQFLTALKYLIKMRLIGERAYTRRIAEYTGTESNYQPQKILEEINNERADSYAPELEALGHTEFSSLDEYYRLFRNRLIRYRDSLYSEITEEIERPDMPEVSIDYEAETTVESFDDTYEYSIDGGAWVACQGGPIALSPTRVSHTLRVRVASGDWHAAGPAALITIPERMQMHFARAAVCSQDNETLTLYGVNPHFDFDILLSESNTAADWENATFCEADADGNLTTAMTEGALYAIYRIQATSVSFASESRAIKITKEQPLEITEEPADAVAPLGETVSTTVVAEGEGLTYQWYYKDPGSAKWTKSTLKVDTYSVALVKSKIGRQVYCVIMDQNGGVVTTRTATLNVEYPADYAPPVITTDAADCFVDVGGTASVTIAAEGYGELNYQWYFRNSGAEKWSKSSIRGTDADTYSCAMNATRDGREIYCVVSDRYGNTARTGTVTIGYDYPEDYAEPVITVEPESVTVGVGEIASATMAAEGEELSYQWYLRDPGASSFAKSSIKTDTYSVKMVPSKSGREVYCVVTDKYGNKAKTQTVTLSLDIPEGYTGPSITQEPENASAPKGVVASATVVAEGVDLSYQWYIRNPGSSSFSKSSITTDTYSVKMVASKSGREIYCVVTDKYGFRVKSATVTLTMES